MEEMIFLYNMSSSYDVVNHIGVTVAGKNEVERIFKEIIDEQIQNGIIFTSGFLNLRLISHPFQYFVFSTIIESSKENKELENKFVSFLRNYLFKEEYTLEEKEVFNTYIKYGLFVAPKEVLAELFNNPSDMKSVFHLRFNRTSLHMNYLNDIGIPLIMKLNVKQINKIVKLLEDKTQDEISDTYSKAIRLYLIFGLDRTIAILRGDYGKVGKAFFDCVSKLNVQDVLLSSTGKKYEPALNQELIAFLFTGDNILKLFEAGSVFETTWYHLVNSFDEIKEMCKGHITIKQVEVILKEKTNRVKYDLDPDVYLLEDYLYEIGLGNKVHKTNEEVYDEVVKVYRDQLKRTGATIPYVEGTLENGYSYKVMRLDDPIAYVLGYRAECCIRTFDIAHNHLLHALHCVNGRILLTYNSNGALASFSPLKRNGELLIANSIEMIGDKNDVEVARAFQAGREAIVQKTRECEGDTGLKVACIGRESYMKPEGRPWPTTIPTPTILEKGEALYSRTDIYHKKLDILYQDSRYDLVEIKYGEVEAIYHDPRPPIQSLKITGEISVSKRNLEKAVQSIEYQLKQKGTQSRGSYFIVSSLNWMEYAFYNKDWYILIDKNGKFYSSCLDDNNEALKEMKATLDVLSEFTKKKELEAYVLSFKREVN